MTVLVDTSALIAFYDRRSADHRAVVEAFRSAPAPLSVSPLVLAEFDFLISKYAGQQVALAAAREIGATMQVEEFPVTDLLAAADVMERYTDLSIGLTDASIVVLAHRCRTERLLTLDRRHFSVVRPLSAADAFILPSHVSLACLRRCPRRSAGRTDRSPGPLTDAREIPHQTNLTATEIC